MTLREQLRENIDKVEDDATLGVTQEVDKIMALVDQYVRTVIGEDEDEKWDTRNGAVNEDLIWGATLNPRQTRNMVREQQRQRAGLEK